MFRLVSVIACLVFLPAMGLGQTTASGPGFKPDSPRSPIALHPQNWDVCRDDPDNARKASSEASEAAGDLDSKSDDFERCQRDPDDYDHRGDGNYKVLIAISIVRETFWALSLFSDAEGGEDEVEDVVGGGLAGERVECP